MSEEDGLLLEPEKSNIILKVKGKEFGGWTGATVSKSLSQMTGAFGFVSTDRFPGDFKKWGIAMEDKCQVLIGDQVLITGYIEDIDISYDATNHNIQIGGRDKTGDLVDCSFTETAKEWNGQKIITVIKALCKPFEIEVEVDDSVIDQADAKTASNTFKATEGDTVFDLILKLCKMKGILPVSYGDGKLTLTGSGNEKAHDVLELGVNIKSGSLSQSNRDRFSTYIVPGQGKDQQNYIKTVEVISQPKGEYPDNRINRHRPIVILPEFGGEQKDCQDLAEWECINRAGNSRSIEYVVQGWQQSNGEVWPLNSLVKVKDEFLEIDGKTWLIASVNFSLSNDSGTITRLSLVPPDTYKPAPFVNPTEKMATGGDAWW